MPQRFTTLVFHGRQIARLEKGKPVLDGSSPGERDFVYGSAGQVLQVQLGRMVEVIPPPQRKKVGYIY